MTSKPKDIYMKQLKIKNSGGLGSDKVKDKKSNETRNLYKIRKEFKEDLPKKESKIICKQMPDVASHFISDSRAEENIELNKK